MSVCTQSLRLVLLTMAALALGLHAATANADTIHVPDDYPTIQEALFVAHDGDTIVVRDGVWTGSLNKNIDFGGLAVTVRSENGPENCVIDCEKDGRGFHFRFDEGPDSIVDGFTITNGSMSFKDGGAIHCEGSSPTIVNCRITGNRVLRGGGVSCFNSSPTITNCTIAGNTASGGYSGYGGGVMCLLSSPTLTNCTITGNSATEAAGGVGCASSSPTITNSILWGDAAQEIYVGSGSPVVAYCDVQGGWSGTGNIDADPLFVDPDNEDFHLSAGSPCIDAGDTTAVSGPVVFGDQEGYARAVDDPPTADTGVPGGLLNVTVDMGAYEFRGPPPIPGDVNGDGCVNQSDLGILLAHWGEGCP